MENTQFAVENENNEPGPLQLFASWPFSTDNDYQEGFGSIVLSGALEGKSQDERETILLQSRIYYFNRMTGHSLTLEDIHHSSVLSRASEAPASGSPAWTPTSAGASVVTTSDEGETRTLSFAELKELIEQGKTDQIPNNRVIPNELNPDMPSQSQARARRKPWELANQESGE